MLVTLNHTCLYPEARELVAGVQPHVALALRDEVRPDQADHGVAALAWRPPRRSHTPAPATPKAA